MPRACPIQRRAYEVARSQDPARKAANKTSRLKHIEKRKQYDHNRYHNDPDRKAWQKTQAAGWRKENKGKVNRITAARRKYIKRATPLWLTDEHRAEIAAIYLEAARRGESVDHIYPLRAKNSCGLHVPWNLQIIPLLDNVRKGNRIDGAE